MDANEVLKQMKPQRKMGKWLCEDCGGPCNRVQIPGAGIMCALCGIYAYAYYKEVNGYWEPAIITAIHGI